MARAIWTGAISFGLVNIPVKLFSATSQKDVRFHQLEEGTGRRIRYKRVAEDTDEEVPYENIVKGYELDKGRFVIVTPEELEAVEPGRSRTIDIEDFIDLDEVDPIYWEKTYYLGPGEGAGAERAYQLLRRALEVANKVAIARFVMRTKQYLATVRPGPELLLLETMLFPDEVRSADAVDNRPADVEVPDRERAMAMQLIESLTTHWDPDRYHDTYRERVLDLIRRKAEGEQVVVEEDREPEAQVVDLMAALEASLVSATQRRSPATTEPGERRDDGGRYRDWSKQRLYDEAQRRGISGRSSMNKDELIEALAEAS